jgi:hypothetical protein
MTSRTIFLSRLIGLYCILAAASMGVRKASVIQTVVALLHDGPLMFILGVLTLSAGLAMVLAHNRWSGAAEAVVTIVGWITLLKGLLFLFLTPEAEADLFLTKLHYEQFFFLYLAISFLIGLYLTYAGFSQRSTA